MAKNVLARGTPGHCKWHPQGAAAPRLGTTDLNECTKKCSRYFLEAIYLSFFWASLGKFGRKFFAPPKICMLLIGVDRGAKGASPNF